MLYLYSMAGVVFTPFAGMLAGCMALHAGLDGFALVSLCLFRRLRYGPEGADRILGRVFVLLGDVWQCAGHHGLEWYGEREIRRWQKERRKRFDAKGKPGTTQLRFIAESSVPQLKASEDTRLFAPINLIIF